MKKQNFNLHTHTARCGHAEGLDIQYVQSAIDAGIQLLGFSEHIPYVEMRLPQCRMLYEQKEEYLQSIRKLQEQFKDQIEIKVGFEIEYTKDHLEYLKQMRSECDYMILGQHCKTIGYEYDCYCSDEDVLIYTEQIEEALENNLVSVIAHPDYYMLGRRTLSLACEEAAHRIAQASLYYDVPLEINLNGFHYGKKAYQIEGNVQMRYPYPFREFWQIIASYGCEVLYGVDAHTPIAFLESDRIELAKEILKDIPLRFIEGIEFK